MSQEQLETNKPRKQRCAVSVFERSAILSFMETDNNYTAFTRTKSNRNARTRLYAYMAQKSNMTHGAIDQYLTRQLRVFRQTEARIHASCQGQMTITPSLRKKIESKMPDYFRYKDIYYRNKQHFEDIPAVDRTPPHWCRSNAHVSPCFDETTWEGRSWFEPSSEDDSDYDYESGISGVEDDQYIEVEEEYERSGSPTPALSSRRTNQSALVLANRTCNNSRVGKSTKRTSTQGKKKSDEELLVMLREIVAQNNAAKQALRDATKHSSVADLEARLKPLQALRMDALKKRDFEHSQVLSKEVNKLMDQIVYLLTGN